MAKTKKTKSIITEKNIMITLAVLLAVSVVLLVFKEQRNKTDISEPITIDQALQEAPADKTQ